MTSLWSRRHPRWKRYRKHRRRGWLLRLRVHSFQLANKEMDLHTLEKSKKRSRKPKQGSEIFGTPCSWCCLIIGGWFFVETNGWLPTSLMKSTKKKFVDKSTEFRNKNLKHIKISFFFFFWTNSLFKMHLTLLSFHGRYLCAGLW